MKYIYEMINQTEIFNPTHLLSSSVHHSIDLNFLQIRLNELSLQDSQQDRQNQTIAMFQQKGPDDNFKNIVQLERLDSQISLQPNEKKTNSEKKISNVFPEPKPIVQVSLKTQIGRNKGLINISQKRLAQSLKRITSGSQTQKQSKKIKNFEIPITFISQSADLVKLKSSNQKSFTSPKMPDLIKIRLKKQLQSIQKSQQSKKPHFRRNHNKSHLERQSTPLIFLQCQFDNSYEQNRHQKAKQKARKSIINERKFNNFKKVQKIQKKKRIQITIDDVKDTIDFTQWNKKTITEETIDVKHLGKQRNRAKYSRLLEYVKKQTTDSYLESPHKRKNRIKTESALYTSLIAADFNILELQGTKILDLPSKTNGADANIIEIRSKLRNGKMTPVQSRPRINIFRKLINSENRTKPVKEEKNLFSKNIDISPWTDLTQQFENGLD